VSPPQPTTGAFEEKHYRSLLKAVSWRLLGTFDTIVLAWLITGHPGEAFSIGLAELLTKTLLYYLHERAWNRARIGRVRRQETEYEI